ncbi:MAG: hypothetical protein MJ187_00995 [Alphaproteobacteria bacterium]|nr:hypothetical protein [Alphaproteobacteria bacterium]
MKKHNGTEICKNAVGTMFLLASAFFVCSTLLSMRSVLADPIAPVNATNQPTGNMSPRVNATRRNTATVRTTTNNRVVNSGGNRTTSSVAGRGVASRNQMPATRSTNITNTPTGTTTARGVSTRSRTNIAGRSNAATTVSASGGRSVRARTGVNSRTTQSRISLQGTAIRGSSTGITNNYTYLQGKLYAGNYSNIIDSQTGLISADAYSTCLEAYYTCMDEICTARNAAQRRCACAGRVKAFAEAETALETANEELIKVSGELALLVANKGKDVSSAFQLTDAEKVMNCVSWQEMADRYKGGYTQIYKKDGSYSKSGSGEGYVDAGTYWCEAHGLYDSGKCSGEKEPNYCKKAGNTFGFDIANIDGNSSDIMASLKSWAEAKESTLTILTENTENLSKVFSGLSNVVSNMSGISGSLNNSDSLQDSLAKTWGYDLFAYAHNNVCSRVLDSCFNGIYEGCGTPPSGGKCANGNTSNCPYNYNSKINVSSAGDITLVERGTNSNSVNVSATCFGYTSASGDPYASLRGPVADARRSVMNKYLLDANADCDAYGEQLRTTAQNIGYQKVAAQQALQQKRLEFVQEAEQTIATEFAAARSNFNECLSELYDCYTDTAETNKNWSASRIKTYCQQVANVPHCYETMVCEAPNNKLAAVITRDVDNKEDTMCDNSETYEKNTCRNVITLNEILSPSYADKGNGAAKKREECLQQIGINGVRKWDKGDTSEKASWPDNDEDLTE